MKVLDLFSGIGGFSLGLESTGHFRTVAFCEIDKFCKLILDKHWKGTKVYDDIKTITKKQFEEDGTEFPDIITGGFPCQPFSVAGKQQGTSDSRHLWPEMFRVIKDFAPRWVIGENVKGLTNIQDGVVFETVCSDLEGEGYEVRTFNIPAAGVQAPHRRERIWIVAHAKRFNERKSIRGSDETQSRIQEEHRQNDSTTRKSSRTGSVWGTNNGHEDMENSRRTLRQGGELQGENGNETREGNADQSQRSSGTSRSNVANTERQRLEGFSEHSTTISRQDQGTHTGDEGSRGENKTMVDSSTGRCTSQETEVQPGRYSSFDSSWWQSEPELGRVAHGVSGRIHRLKALGNSIVPKIVQEIGNAIIKAEKEKDLEILDQRNGM
jgi:DNA (cytosine-5)-methyltransferase 1